MATQEERRERKRQTARLVMAGHSTEQIATMLSVKGWTIARYRQELVWEGRIPKYKHALKPLHQASSLQETLLASEHRKDAP